MGLPTNTGASAINNQLGVRFLSDLVVIETLKPGAIPEPVPNKSEVFKCGY